jgi:hypothetical protein
LELETKISVTSGVSTTESVFNTMISFTPACTLAVQEELENLDSKRTSSSELSRNKDTTTGGFYIGDDLAKVSLKKLFHANVCYFHEFLSGRPTSMHLLC